MLLDTLRTDATASLKAGEKKKTETLRFVLAAVKNQGIELHGAGGEAKMSDDDIVSVLKKQAKTRRESIDAYAKAGRDDLVKIEEEELAIIQGYLPAEISDEDLETLLKPVVQNGVENFGQAMGEAMSLAAGKADGKRVSEMLKRLMKP